LPIPAGASKVSEKITGRPNCIPQFPLIPPGELDAGVVTVMLANADADPPLPAHVRVYVEFAVRETVSEPLTVCVPLQLPDAEQLVALVELHVSVEDWPTVIDVGVAVRVTVGVGVDAVVTVTLADAVPNPPAPVQVRV
jgi:hypothetical protein